MKHKFNNCHIYTVTANGNYQVAVANAYGCRDTSAVYPVDNYTGIQDVNALANYIRVYPNPAADVVYIQSPVKVNIMLTDLEGRIIREVEDANNLSLKNLPDGMYFLRIADKNGALIKTIKVIRLMP